MIPDIENYAKPVHKLMVCHPPA